MFTNYTQLERGWLRTDKFFQVSEKDAKAITTGLGSGAWAPMQSPTDRSFAIRRFDDPGDANLMRDYLQRVETYLQAPKATVLPSLYPSVIQRLSGK